MVTFTHGTSDESSAHGTTTSSVFRRPSLSYTEDGPSKSLEAFTDGMSQSNSFNIANTGSDDNSLNAKKRLVDKLNQQIIAEYEDVRQANILAQQNYRATVDRFLTFASENKQIYSKILELHKRVVKEHENYTNKLDPQMSLHLRLVVNVSLLYFRNNEKATSMANLLIKSPYVALHAFQDAIQEVWRSQNSKLQLAVPNLGVCGWLGRNHVTPRGLTSSMINNLVAVEGVVNKCSSIHPKLSQSIYVGEPIHDLMNEMEKTVHLRNHYDLTDFTRTAKDNGNPPPSDPEGKIVHRQEIGLCNYRNYQTFVVQETPEDSFTGQMPRYVSVIVQDDLCNIVKCGDRVRVWGVYRVSGGRADDTNTSIGKGYLVANHVTIKDKLSQKISHEITQEDRAKFKLLSSRDDCLHILTRSIAPSICGQEAVKRGLLLQLVGGPENDESADHRIRGDVHVLLVGDPGCGKSQMLRYVMTLFPNTISTTGRGSTGVGLTAAVVSDQETGERRVEGGAMVLGDRRIVCIDEFDKMEHGDRVAIHEVMEQQTVTIAKAGIHTTLNARCTVLAAANPIYGCWSEGIEISQQLNFERSLLSRFDLIFVVRDAATEEEDNRIAQAVLRNITQKSKVVKTTKGIGSSEGGTASCVIQPIDDDMNQVAFSNMVIRGAHCDDLVSVTPTRKSKKTKISGQTMLDDVFKSRGEMTYSDVHGEEYDVLDTQFLRKYLYYCKHLYYREMESMEGWKPCPEISDAARRAIVQLYSHLRERAKQCEVKNRKLTQAVTPRTLEAIVRLSVAHARLRLSRWVTRESVDAIGKLLGYTLFGDVYDPFAADQEDDDDEEEILIDDKDSDYEYTKRTRRVAQPQTQPQVQSPAAAIENRPLAPEPTKILLQGNDEVVGELLKSLKKLDVGDGVDVTDLYLDFCKATKMSRPDFNNLLEHLHNLEPSPILYSPEDFRVFSC
ncbi:bifunctional P-loop containing nucleoside triphosphate hydrolase/AAA+ ATPase domain/MCM domain/Nucleic acid-binding [Babesia duncani]|uniref:Bifunctional P-loop containing nucleoside triphosphate hydrolase/AAA+ ATPase domain/MCM domain/Nucleic acid-binding n=1 Tax=Babesia duncani TaxID=323732 RepID=A0AAD9PNJ3_9APIC|nr:bifunctional P-loop containing nucleoside triphosphate hydrolase/AAA+ ATPase domain/MCM domain/Nucleic acid-binding [Babesia duncani]